MASMLAGCGKSESGAASPAALTSPASAASQNTLSATAQDLPAEVMAFRAKRDLCDHFRGEEPYDAKRAAFLKAEMVRTCSGTDQALADLRRRYASDPKVIAALKDYESRIE